MDKVAHFVMYGILGVLIVYGWQRAGRWPRLFWPLLLAILAGTIDELHQMSLNSRSAEFADWIADVTGVLVGAMLVRRYTQRKPVDVV